MAPPRRRERAPPRALEGPIWPFFGRGRGVWAVGEECAVCACTLGVRGARGTAARPRGTAAKLCRGRRAALSGTSPGCLAAPVTISMYKVSGVPRRGSGRLVAGLAVPHGHVRCSESPNTMRHHLYWSPDRPLRLLQKSCEQSCEQFGRGAMPPAKSPRTGQVSAGEGSRKQKTAFQSESGTPCFFGPPVLQLRSQNIKNVGARKNSLTALVPEKNP